MHIISVTFTTRTVEGNNDTHDRGAALQWVNIEWQLDGLIESSQLEFDHSNILTDY